MKMAKASDADIDMAVDLAAAFDALTHRWYATMPEAVQILRGNDDSEPFDRDDDEQCGRALRHLLDVVDRGSLFRVIMGMAVLLDPRNRIVDPALSHLEHHPAAREAARLHYRSEPMRGQRPTGALDGAWRAVAGV